MRIIKGDHGYIRQQKRVRFIRTLFLFALAFGIFLFGLHVNNGDKRSIYTIVAIVGMIPVSMSIVSTIMMWMRRPMDEGLHARAEAHRAGVYLLYELFLTTRDKNLFLDVTALGQDVVIAYTHEKVDAAHIRFMEEHITKTLRAGGYKRLVKIFQDEKAFFNRLDGLAAHADGPDEQAPLVAAALCAVAL